MGSTTKLTAVSVEFDDILDELELSSFEQTSRRILRRLDRNGAAVSFDFKRLDPSGSTFRSSNLLNYYRHEVSRIPQLDRDQEIKFCMGIELLWRRLKSARRAAGFSQEDVESYPGTANPDFLSCPAGSRLLCHGCATDGISHELADRLRDRHREFETARNEIMARHLFLVFSLLNRYRSVNVSEEDLIQEANLSLFKAVRGFDFSRGVRFRTYAGYWVNQAFLNAIYNQSRVVRVPAYIQKAMKKVNDALGFNGDPNASEEELADKSGITTELLRSATKGNRFTISLDKPIDADGVRMIELFSGADEAESPEFGETQNMEIHLAKAMARLNERERLVLTHRFGLNGHPPSTLQVVGEILGVSLERIRQIQKAALNKLRNGPRSSSLAEYA